MGKADPPCQAEACTLQTCLSKHPTTPDLCQRQLKQLYQCCASMYEGKFGDGERERGSTACPMESVVRRWLREHSAEGEGEGEGGKGK